MSLKLDRSIFGNEINKGHSPTLEEANKLLDDWVKNDRLKLHMRQVGHVMKSWAAKKENLDEKLQHHWYIAGLLHDADWDQWPDEHCRLIIEELEKRNTDPEIIHAIASHGPRFFGVEPETKMDKMLYAFDELSGFMHAYSLMRPNGYDEMEVKGVMKRLKDKTFAANVSRDDINDACSRAGLTLSDVITFIIAHQNNNGT